MPIRFLPAAGIRKLLGSKVREGWPEVADFNDNVMKVGLSGGTLAYKDQELTLYRHGQPEQVWMNLDYSPVLNEAGRAGGRDRHRGRNDATGDRRTPRAGEPRRIAPRQRILFESQRR